jgi:spermidine synthase
VLDRRRWENQFFPDLQIVMVDIDGVVVDFCRQNLPQNASAFADPRLQLIIDDAKGKLESFPPASFDVILMDLDDPLEGGPCYWVRTGAYWQCESYRNAAGWHCSSGFDL